MKKSADIRQAYLDFFAQRGHAVQPSAPIIPLADPTLLFNSAGMVPFKPYFLGQKTGLPRAASCQKCFRTTDIERVGATLRHLTFFEMLGNFSFGDYFKQEAIAWAWEFLTGTMAFDKSLLHATVFKDDTEALEMWKKLGVKNPIGRLGEDTNFWNMGPTGPCGPCSEIYYDRGSAIGCGKPDCAPGCDCDRYLEIWNLVFTQFDRQADGSLKSLPRKNIDTGMGLERLVLALDNAPSPFDTDLFAPIVRATADITGADPGKPENARAFRVIADHSRAAIMLMSEGLIPSNVERGYVLRRLIRRAARYGQLLGYPKPFLHTLVPAVIDIFGGVYPELRASLPQVVPALKTEEEKFHETLQMGERELEILLANAGKVLPGEQAFRLYETFGFPLELTREIVAHRGMTVDEEAFQRAAEKASQLARASWKGSGELGIEEAGLTLSPTRFTGYTSLEDPAVVDASRLENGRGFVILDQTPFYAEGGGQVGDTGWLLDAEGKNMLAEVVDTRKQGETHMHLVANAQAAALASGKKVIARVDAARRARIRPHHTGTHLLNEALKRVLGQHVRQAGSYVGPDKLRFDFTHPKALTPDELARIEAIVNTEIQAKDPVIPREMPKTKVAEFGAVTLLGEEYGDNPRFLMIGPKGWDEPKNRFSLELCGGTHVSNTSEILGFKIVREASAAAGVRRIEAITGLALADWEAKRKEDEKKARAALREEARALLAQLKDAGAPDAEPLPLDDEAALRGRIKTLKNALEAAKSKRLSEQAGTARQLIKSGGGVTLCAERLEGADPKSLRTLSDRIKTELGSGLIFLAAPGGGKLSFILTATPDLAARGVDAAKIAKTFAAANGGSAGGRADFAQGGCADGDWNTAVASLSKLVA